MTPEQLAIKNVGKQDPKRHLEEKVDTLMASNIVQCLGAMLDTVVFKQPCLMFYFIFVAIFKRFISHSIKSLFLFCYFALLPRILIKNQLCLTKFVYGVLKK